MAYGKDTAFGPLGPLAGFMRLTPDSRAPTWVCVGLGVFLSLSLSLSLSFSLSEKLSYLAHILALGWAKWGPCGVCWAHLGPMLSLCWAYIGLC